MAVAYTGVGSRNGPAAGTGNSLTLTGNVAAGDLVVVMAAVFNKLDATSTLTDTKGNLYRAALVLDGSAAQVGAALAGSRQAPVLIPSHPLARLGLPFASELAQAAGNVTLLIFYAVSNQAMTNGVDSVTMTYRLNGQLVQNTDFSITAIDVSGLPNPVLDAVGSGVGFGTAASAGSVTTQVGNEAMIGAFAVNGPALDAFTAGGGWTTTGRAAGGGEINTEVSPQTQTAAAPGSFASTATLGIARLWVAGVVTFRTGDAYGIVRGPAIRGSLARQQLIRPFESADRYTDAQAPPSVLADLVAALQSRSTSHWRVWRIKNRPPDVSWMASQVTPVQGPRQSRRLASSRRRAVRLPIEQSGPPSAIQTRLRRLLRRQPRRSDLTLPQAPPNPWQVVSSFRPLQVFRRFAWRRRRPHDEPGLMPQQAAANQPPYVEWWRRARARAITFTRRRVSSRAISEPAAPSVSRRRRSVMGIRKSRSSFVPPAAVVAIVPAFVALWKPARRAWRWLRRRLSAPPFGPSVPPSLGVGIAASSITSQGLAASAAIGQGKAASSTGAIGAANSSASAIGAAASEAVTDGGSGQLP